MRHIEPKQQLNPQKCTIIGLGRFVNKNNYLGINAKKMVCHLQKHFLYVLGHISFKYHINLKHNHLKQNLI